jgi:hypothetical protein
VSHSELPALAVSHNELLALAVSHNDMLTIALALALAGDCARDEHLQVHEQQGAVQERTAQACGLNRHACHGAHQ